MIAKTTKLTALAVGSTICASSFAAAAPITPVFQTFGELARTEFGGDGIPNDAVAFSTFTADNGDQLTLGLAATERFENQPVGNDGAGTFSAQPGANNGTPGDGGSAAVWNFSFFAEIADSNGNVGAGTTTFADLGVELLYDLDPGLMTDEGALGVIDIAVFEQLAEDDPNALNDGPSLFQTSQNSTFNYLANDNAGFNTAPDFTAFDPFASGEYSFALRSSLGQVAINVNVGNVGAIPLPAPAFLLIGAMAALGFAARRKA